MQGIFRFTSSKLSCRLILVNNGSSDNTKGQIEQEIKNNKSSNAVIKLVNLNFNKGYGGYF